MSKDLTQHLRRKTFAVCAGNLRNLRLARELTQAELALKSGYSERLIRKAEAGGRLNLATLQDLATVLSTVQREVHALELVISNVASAKMFIDAYDRFGRQMLAHCIGLFSTDFCFLCKGDSASPLSGKWVGTDGLQAWLDQLFAMIERPREQKLVVRYLEATDAVVAHYEDVFLVAGRSEVMWVNLHFTFKNGLIACIEDEYDTQLAIAFEKRIAESRKDPQFQLVDESTLLL